RFSRDWSSDVCPISAAEVAVFNQGLAVFLDAASQFLEVGQGCLGQANASQASPLIGEQVLGVGPAFVLFAHQVFHRYFYIVEEHFVHLVLTLNGDDGAHGDAGGVHVDQQEGNARLGFCFRIGPHQAEDHVG